MQNVLLANAFGTNWGAGGINIYPKNDTIVVHNRANYDNYPPTGTYKAMWFQEFLKKAKEDCWNCSEPFQNFINFKHD